ncbi:MAG: protein kinase [Opitutales bacterium]|nr:protein kinase [Opitutales bacterium]
MFLIFGCPARIGEASNDGERKAIAYLQAHLPDDYRVLHNFELKKGRQWYEIDLAIIAPHAVYLVDVKGTHGQITVANGKWHPEGRAAFHSPLPKLRDHAKVAAGLLADGPGKPYRDRVWFEAAVLLVADNAVFIDREDRDRPATLKLAGCEAYFQAPGKLSCSPGYPREATDPHLKAIHELFHGTGVRASKGLPLFGTWQCVERLTSTDTYVEYRAEGRYAKGSKALVRVYHADPYAQEAERTQQKRRIENAYQALESLAAHPAIPTSRDFFPTENGDGYVMVTDDFSGEALARGLQRTDRPLTLDQKLGIAEDILDALAHCHKHGVLHRALSPATVVLAADGRVRLTDFDFARPPERGTSMVTVAGELVGQVREAYLAPEVLNDASNTSPGTDVYATGVLLYEVLTGSPPWPGVTEAHTAGCSFPEPVSAQVAALPEGFDAWLQGLCAKEPAERPAAKDALEALRALLQPVGGEEEEGDGDESRLSGDSLRSGEEEDLDYLNLAPGTTLDGKFSVERKLGKPGSFGVVYKVVDTMGDVARAVKIILRDRTSVVSRMKQEFRTLANLPPHPRVVRVFDARILNPGGYPYLVFEYLEGSDLKAMIEANRITLAESVKMAREVAEGLAHLHRHNVMHGDIKPANLLWTDHGVKIVDFNVAKAAEDLMAQGGGTKHYLPSDYNGAVFPSADTRQDRDLFALGVTFYEAVTGRFPWPDDATDTSLRQPIDPREFSGLENLSQKLVSVLLRMVDPERRNRYPSAQALLEDLANLGDLRQSDPAREATITQSWEDLGEARRPNTNPFAEFLLTLYSQSQRTNAGTRGLDEWSRRIYIDTQLDRTLKPALLDGEYKLVVISGNAGDGKTAFIQQVEREAREQGASVEPVANGNGAVFHLKGHAFRSNYDGSQDEGDKVNDAVLLEFFKPFEGGDAAAWPTDETRMIAINEGRLIDFLEQHGKRFVRLKALIGSGFKTGKPEDGIAVVNLNLRSVVAPMRMDDGSEMGSILERLLAQMVKAKFWHPCAECDLAAKCYAHHNARTFQDPVAGKQVVERLLKLHTLTTLRSKLHITLRDLRSALAHMLVGTRTCDEIHTLYAEGRREEILNSFYFNSWMGGGNGEPGDRLIRLLRESDIGQSGDAQLDRLFAFHPPRPAPHLVSFEERGSYDAELLTAVYEDLPAEFGQGQDAARFQRHRRYVAMVRRRHFFECRDPSWERLLPYKSSASMLKLVQGINDPVAEAARIIRAINKGEGVFESNALGNKLALQVRSVDQGTVRCYRLFPAKHFRLEPIILAEESPFMEHAPSLLKLRFDAGALFADDRFFEEDPELEINLDVYEMLFRLNEGYRPTVDELHGFYLSLNVFKNVLGSVPYEEILLTPSGKEFYAIRKVDTGRLEMRVVEDPAAYGDQN